MEIPLRERDGNAFLIESQLHLFRQVEEQTPVIGGVYPDPGGDVHGAVCQFGYHDLRFGIGQRSAVFLNQSLNGRFRLGNIVGVADTENEVHTPGGFVPLAAAVKAEVGVPVIAVGRIEPEQADALIGAGGLGENVFQSLSQRRTGRGIAAGLAIVAVAMVLERVTSEYSGSPACSTRKRGSFIPFLPPMRSRSVFQLLP